MVTAGTVRFSFREIVAAPSFCFANPFRVLTSVAVQGRVFFFFTGIAVSNFRTACIPQKKLFFNS
jgi:hypothetical protein